MRNPEEIRTARELIRDGKLDEASTLLRRCLERDAANAEVWLLMAQVVRLAGDPKMALELIGTALSRQARRAEFLIEKAMILAALGRVAEARAICERGLDFDKLNFESHAALGRYHISLGQLDPAVRHLRAAIKLRPGIAETHSLLGHVLMDVGNWADAEASLQACLKLEPNHVRGLWGLGNLYRQRARTGEAIESYHRALALKPNEPSLLSNLGNTWLDLGEHEQAIACYAQALRQNPNSSVTHSNLIVALHYASVVDRNQIAAAHREWASRHARNLPRLRQRAQRPPSDGRKLRLGLVSADFRQHPVGRVAEVLCRYLDSARFDLLIYDNGTRADQTTATLQSLISNWRKIAHLSDDAAAKLIFDDGIDILADLSGHTGGHRLLVFARQPAPLQITLFAYPNTTGLETMQYRITDLDSDPPGVTDALYTETLVRLSKIAWACMPPSDAPSIPTPATGEAPFIFGCLNNPSKISAACAQVWSEILKARPDSRLMLLVRNDPEHERRLLAKFGKFGVRPEQLRFVPQTSQSGYLGYHYSIDLMLDPFPYNGGVTTWDALWMGVPVLTLAGDSYVSRQGISLLKNAGLNEFVVASGRELVERAVTMAGAGRLTERRRQEIRGRLQHSALMDYASYGNELSQVLLKLWEAP
ncbi:MAG: tetratricopeptide repeat protein [Verrucomicrobia bacterium]|nr:tetratricopeptide repeat protein [Verrucomicrobiota bacterium]